MFSLHRCVSCISPHVAVAELVARPREGLLRAALATVRARKRLLTRVDLGRLLSHKVHSTGVLHTSQSLSSTFDFCLTGFFYSTLAGSSIKENLLELMKPDSVQVRFLTPNQQCRVTQYINAKIRKECTTQLRLSI